MRTTSKHIIISLYKINDKEKILKIVREKIYYIKRNRDKDYSRFVRNNQVRRQ